MKLEEGQQLSNPVESVDNLNRKYFIGKSQYLLLIKKQKQKNYATLYLTDCQSNIWLKKIDTAFFKQLKEELSLTTSLSTFSKHFTQHLLSNSALIPTPKGIKVQVQLRIGQGLIMNCDFQLTDSICLQIKPHDFKIAMKLFLRQLYEAKESQIATERKKWEIVKQEERGVMPNKDKMDVNYVKEVLNGNLKKNGAELKLKNRSLMNPNQKKRKQAGIKFNGEAED